MTSATNGYAIWPSGVRSIVIGTTDGWRTVVNRTPLAVPTDGGMVLAATPQSVVTGVLPFHLLTISPVLTSSDQGKTWTGSQLTGPLMESPNALARLGTTTFALLAKTGELIAQRDGQQTWSHVTSPRELDPSGAFKPQGVASPDGTTLFVVGANSATRGASAFASTDAGETWKALVLGATGGLEKSSAPCATAAGWLVPMRSQGGGVIHRLTRKFVELPMPSDVAIVPASNPVIACGGGLLWISVTRGNNTRVVTVDSKGDPHYLGDVSGRITAMAPTSSTQAIVATSDLTKMGALTTLPALHLTPISLPTWVSTVGGSAMRN
jgi:hypothetical protein